MNTCIYRLIDAASVDGVCAVSTGGVRASLLLVALGFWSTVLRLARPVAGSLACAWKASDNEGMVLAIRHSRGPLLERREHHVARLHALGHCLCHDLCTNRRATPSTRSSPSLRRFQCESAVHCPLPHHVCRWPIHRRRYHNERSRRRGRALHEASERSMGRSYGPVMHVSASI